MYMIQYSFLIQKNNMFINNYGKDTFDLQIKSQLNVRTEKVLKVYARVRVAVAWVEMALI